MVVGVALLIVVIVAIVVIGSGEPQASDIKSSQVQETSNVEPKENTGTPFTPATLTTKSEDSGLFNVVKVVDGDTLSVNINGKITTLRLIGINTPETVDPRKPVECFGREASAKAHALLDGKRVRLEYDQSQGVLDKYGRTLAYVFLEDGLFFNKYMIAEGYAYEYTYNLPYKYQAEFKQAQKDAEVGEKGLWAPGVCEAKSTPSTSSGQAIPTLPQAGSYNCSSNTYNCTDFSTHAEAQTVFEACGGASNDVHELDREGDGLACEGLP